MRRSFLFGLGSYFGAYSFLNGTGWIFRYTGLALEDPFPWLSWRVDLIWLTAFVFALAATVVIIRSAKRSPPNRSRLHSLGGWLLGFFLVGFILVGSSMYGLFVLGFRWVYSR